MKKEILIGEHMKDYTKLLADLANVNVSIEKEDKALILLSSLPGEDYEAFVFTLINNKQSLSYNEVSSALVNHKLRRKDKESFKNTSAEALTVRGRSFSWKGKDKCGISMFRLGFRDLNKK